MILKGVEMLKFWCVRHNWHCREIICPCASEYLYYKSFTAVALQILSPEIFNHMSITDDIMHDVVTLHAATTLDHNGSWKT